MTEIISSNKTIAKNTLFLYARMLFNLVVSLYTSRIILDVLGVTDLGVFQVVAGIITIFTFFNSGLAGATSRFLAFEIGQGNKARLQRTFSSAVNAYIFFSLLVLFLGETIGLWFVLNKLVIPEGRKFAALIIYQCSIVMTIITLLQVPYNASIIANEKMKVFAYIGILDTLLKLLVTFLLYVIAADHFISYGFLLVVSSLVIFSCYTFYCHSIFQECKFCFKRDKEILKPLLVFSGWDVFGNFGFAVKAQGQNVLLNVFFGVVVNAACGFANTIYGAVTGFANNFMMSVRPSITKAYSVGNYTRMQQLIIDSAKYSFCLMLFLSIPFLFEGDFILKVWLKNPPPYTVVLCQLQLITFLIANVFFPIRFGIIATGKNKYISMLDGFIFLAYLPISYLILKLGGTPYSPFLFMIALEIIKSNYYTKLLKGNWPDFKLFEFYRKGIFPCIIVSGITLLSCFAISRLFVEEGWLSLLSVSSTAVVVIALLILFYFWQREERIVVFNLIKSKLPIN